MAILEETYRPEAVEIRQYETWQRAGRFAANPSSAKPPYNSPYTIQIPPPNANVTGSLHMGHAL